jgi:hypothetical protein
MFTHNIYHGKQKYNKKNKAIIVVIRKQPGEIDWVLPILNNLKKNFNVILIFEKDIALQLLKQNKVLYELFLESICCYVINSSTKCFFLRVLLKIFKKIQINKFSKIFQNEIYKNYYDINELIIEIKNILPKFNSTNIKILMQDFTDNSPWIKKFSENNQKIKIISYPHTTNIFSAKKKFMNIRNNENNKNILFLSSHGDYFHFKNKFKYYNTFICGYPKYHISWLKKVEKKSKVISRRKSEKIIFVSYKGFDSSKYYKKKYIEQVSSLFEFVKKNKKCRLVFKFHPNAQEEKVFLKIANQYSSSLWSITQQHLHNLSLQSNAFVSFFSNASTLDSLASNKPPIELWNISLNKKQESLYSKLKICFNCENKDTLFENLDYLLFKKFKSNKEKYIFKNFKKILKPYQSIKLTSNLIKKISN